MDISLAIAQQAQQVKVRPVGKRETAFRKEVKGGPKEYQEEFNISQELMPVRCYTCGKVNHAQTKIEQFIETSPLFLKEDVSSTKSPAMLEIYKMAGAVRLCCKRMFLTSPLIIRLIDERMKEINAVRRLSAGGRGDFLLGPLEPHRDPLLPRQTQIPRLGAEEDTRQKRTIAADFSSVSQLEEQIKAMGL